MAEFRLPDLPEPAGIVRLLFIVAIIWLVLGALIGGTIVWFLK